MSKLIWTNGCFDVLHHGHFKLIEYAASFGGQVIVGIDSDRRVKHLKGEDRPFHNQQQRAYNLRQLRHVFDIKIFDTEEELRNILQSLRPDIFVIGSDYINRPIVGSEFVNEVRFFMRMEEFSTTKILYE